MTRLRYVQQVVALSVCSLQRSLPSSDPACLGRNDRHSDHVVPACCDAWPHQEIKSWGSCTTNNRSSLSRVVARILEPLYNKVLRNTSDRQPRTICVLAGSKRSTTLFEKSGYQTGEVRQLTTPAKGAKDFSRTCLFIHLPRREFSRCVVDVIYVERGLHQTTRTVFCGHDPRHDRGVCSLSRLSHPYALLRHRTS